ncbi:MAG: ABC transporter ATP-binding protein [Acidobacteria bacterium]|nr:ABC transporter ATP-binding protein [Acidobacteriota bacterium]
MATGPLRQLIDYALRYRRSFALGLVCTALSTAMSLTAPWVLKHAVDDLTLGVTMAKLQLYASLVLGLALVGGWFRFLMRRILVGASRHIEYDLRNAFFAHLQRLPPAYFHASRTGDLMSRATNDLNAVRMMIGPAVMYSANTLIVFVVALALMLRINTRLTLIALIPLPFVSVSVRYFGAAIHRRFERIQAQLSDLSAVAQEALAGVRVVRAYRQESAELDRFRDANHEYVRRNLGLIRLQGMFYPSLGLLLGIGGLLVLWLGSREVMRHRMTIGEFVAFNAYLGMLTWPMIAFGWVTNMLQRGAASWKRMLEVMSKVPAVSDSRAGTAFRESADIHGAIEIRNLTFAYDGRPILRDVSLSVAPGRTLAIVGATGSGKSTLINLLPRLYEPPPGTVFIDGVDVGEIPLYVLRGAIGFVSQEPFLFSESISENVAFGVQAQQPATTGLDEASAGHARGKDGGPVDRADGARAGGGADEHTVAGASAVARLDKDVAGFPAGYDTVVGERGITLSGGQKQRTALARAVMTDPRILILDDALSAVDTYTEEEILSRLRRVMKQRTSIIVSHRISTVREADQIVVLGDGQILERGSHAELVAQNGVYAEMCRKQMLEEELQEAL